MKRITLLFAFVVCFAFVTNAQEQGEIRVGAGLALGTKSGLSDIGEEKSGIGINIGGEYFVSDIISIAPSYTTFFKADFPFGIGSSKFASFNIDGRYYFMTDDIQVYGMAGLSFASQKIDITEGGVTVSGSESKTGLNIGGGVVIPLADQFGLNAELKYNTPIAQLVIGAGIRYTL